MEWWLPAYLVSALSAGLLTYYYWGHLLPIELDLAYPTVADGVRGLRAMDPMSWFITALTAVLGPVGFIVSLGFITKTMLSIRKGHHATD